jgi:hypothetical protein
MVDQPGGAQTAFDAKFELEFDDTRVEVYAEVKTFVHSP